MTRHLSQNTKELQFGVPVGDAVEKIEVRWPGGTVSSHAGPEGKGVRTLEIEQTRPPE